MLGDINKIHCNKCGKYLFTETDTKNGMKRTDDNRDYRYDEIADEFICNDCDNEVIVMEFTEKELEQIRYALEYLHDTDLSDYGNDNIEVLESVMNKLEIKLNSQL